MAAKRRAQNRTKGASEGVSAPPDLASGALIGEVAAECRRARERVATLEARAVVLGRAEGWSWDRLGVALGTPGETLRRRYAEPHERAYVDRYRRRLDGL